MPPALGQPFDPSWRGSPPRMAPQDLILWHRARHLLTPGAAAIFYDVQVGESARLPDGETDVFADAFRAMTRLRLDAVVQTPSEWRLIEIRPNAGPGALGSIISYRSLWDRDPPDSIASKAYLVTDRGHPSIITTAINWGITPIIV